MNDSSVQYGGFWIRAGASVIDTLLMMLLLVPILYAFYGKEYFFGASVPTGRMEDFLNYVLPAGVVIIFWVYRSATPGKMVMSLTIVDAATGHRPSTGQFIGRYFAYYLSALPAGLGFLWVAWDARKQGWHDKLAGTLVVKNFNPHPGEPDGPV
jgi:uncharacterized RDD family membrane protein YckC